MSVFKGHDDLSLNRYYYSFYSFSQDDPNTIKSFVYDQNQTLVSSKDISFNTRNIPDMLSFLENSQSNPYALGKSNDEFLNMDITFAGLYKKALTENQQQSLMTTINKTYKNVYYGTVNTFTIQVTQSAQDPTKPVFIFNGDTSVENPMVPVGTVGLYIFDQSHPSNAGFPIAFRDMQSFFTPYTNVIVEGTPGTPNSYSLVSITDVSAPLLVEYYTTSTETNAEFIFGELLNYLYQVKVETNIVGDPVFAIQSPGQSAYVLQPDLSFNIGDLVYFYVGDDSMADISLVFGPTVDDTASMVGSPYYVKMGDIIRLDLTSGYTGDRLVYFEDSSAGMGYAPASSSSSSSGTSGTAPQLLNNSFESSSLVGSSDTFQIYFGNTNIDNWTTIGPNSNSNRTFIVRDNDTAGFNFPTPFVNGSYCMALGCQEHGGQIETGYIQQIITLPVNNYILSWYDVLRTYSKMVSEPIRIKITKKKGEEYTVIHTHEYLVTNTAWTEKTTSFSITEEASYIVSFESYYIDINKFGQTAFDNVTFSIAPPPVENYTVDVSNNSVFRLDSGSGFVEKPAIDFANNSGTTYIFDQSHASNTGNTLVIGTAPDISSSIVSSGLTIMGTPGQAGAYTKYVSDGTPVYYFSYQTENMGIKPPQWTLLFRQTNPYRWSSSNSPATNSLNPDNPSDENYSILNTMYQTTNYKNGDGDYHFKYIDKTNNKSVEWKQTSNFVESTTNSVTGYQLIGTTNVADNPVPNNFGGLSASGGSYTHYDGSPGSSHWWYTIAVITTAYNMPTFDSDVSDWSTQVELWVYAS